MASSNHETSRYGGRVNADTGMLLTAEDIDRIGEMAMQSHLAFLSLLFFDHEQGNPKSGFPREELDTNHCTVTSTGDLSFTIATGIGYFFDSAASTSEFGPARYRPVVVNSTYSGSLSAHHATLPRLDIVCLGPEWADDQSASRNVKDPGTGSVTSSSINQRRRYSYKVTIVAGTPASSPTAPAVPSGYMEIARALVPATSGAASWEDTRQVLEFGHYFKGLPRYACDNYVPLGGAAELEVTATSPASMAVNVARGRAVINGVMRSYPARVYPPITIAAADPSDDRYDLIIARQSGILDVVTGTPSGSPSVPSLPAGAIRLAKIFVEAASTTVTSGDITDLREREPFDGQKRLQERSVTQDRMETPCLAVSVGAAAISGNMREISVTLTDLDGNALSADDGTITMMAEIFHVDNDEVSILTEYDTTPGTTISEEDYPSTTGGRPDFVLSNDADGTDDTLRGPRMKFTMTDPTAAYAFHTRRRDAANTGTVMIRVWSMSHPSTTGEYTFVWP